MTSDEAARIADEIVYGKRVDMGKPCNVTGVYTSRCEHCGAEPMNATIVIDQRTVVIDRGVEP